MVGCRNRRGKLMKKKRLCEDMQPLFMLSNPPIPPETPPLNKRSKGILPNRKGDPQG